MDSGSLQRLTGSSGMKKGNMKKTDLSKFDDSWYKPGGRLKRLIWYLMNIMILKSSLPWPSRLKVAVLRLFGAKIGKGVLIRPCVNIKYPWFLEVGNHVWMGEEVWIDNLGKVKIENNGCISQGALILCCNHNYKKESFDLMVADITLEEGAWVGANAVVCPGVTLKSHSVLAVNSVLTHDTEPYGIYQGNPAVLVKKRVISE
jgi:putative colanic acid biosynthesis acetyltransferase WcaF